MRHVKPVLVLFASLAFSLPVWADTDPEVASYGIPTDAVKVHFGPSVAPVSANIPLAPPRLIDPKYVNGYIAADCYFVAGAPQDQAHLIAQDFYASTPWGADETGRFRYGQYRLYRYRRELYKDGQLHGIRREWYSNGELCSEVPFKAGVMDGIVTYRNIWGQIVGQYEIKAGNGKRRLYYDDGQLQFEDELKNGMRNGTTVQFYPDGQVKSVWHFKDDDIQGFNFGLGTDGSILYIGCANGPALYFLYRPIQTSLPPLPEYMGIQYFVEWHLNNNPVSEDEYAAAASKDHHLPPYYKDLSLYHRYFSPIVTAQVAKYKHLPRVLIPLLLDEKGNALPAPR